jgi:hypothetical protein
MTTKTTDQMCQHIRSEHIVPGWGCCKCRVYNGYQRAACRSCGHVPCYLLEGVLGKEARDLAPIGSNPDLVRDYLEKQKGGT